MALTEGQCVEVDVLASLIAAVRAARESAGTLGVAQRGEGPLAAAGPCPASSSRCAWCFVVLCINVSHEPADFMASPGLCRSRACCSSASAAGPHL